MQQKGIFISLINIKLVLWKDNKHAEGKKNHSVTGYVVGTDGNQINHLLQLDWRIVNA